MATTLENSTEELDIGWDAVFSRDSLFDGLFVYAMASTGVYWMPSCPIHKLLKKNMSFFAMPELAKPAGFRTCLHCQPDDHTSEDAGLSTVRDVCRMIGKESKGCIP
jgi:AraC family transcriptional regulator of adaptative response/methylated-DNA-[protein]-cysteine methyltransferase